MAVLNVSYDSNYAVYTVSGLAAEYVNTASVDLYQGSSTVVDTHYYGAAQIAGHTSFGSTFSGLIPNTTYTIWSFVWDRSGNLVSQLSQTFTTPSPPAPTWVLSTANYGTVTAKTTNYYTIGGYVLKRISVSFSSSGIAYFYSTGSYDTYGFLSTRTEWNDTNGAPLYPIAQNDDDTTGKTTGYNFGIAYEVTAGTTYYLWVRELQGGGSIYCGIVVESPTPPTGNISGSALSATSYTVTATNMQVNPTNYYAIFVADLNADGTISGYHCRYYAKPTVSSYTYNGTTSAQYSKNIRPVYLAYTASAFTVGTKYQLSAFSAYIIASGAVPATIGATPYIYHNDAWRPATPYIYHDGWKLATPNLYYGGWN